MQDMTQAQREGANLAAKFKKLKEEAGITKAEFARRYKVPGGASMISQHISGHRPIGLEHASAYMQGFGCSIEEISPSLAVKLPPSQTPVASDAVMPAPIGLAGPPEGYIRLEHLSAQPAMGTGAVVDELEHVVQHLDVLERWVREEVGSVDAQRVKVLTGVGHSMMPTIQHRDLVFVDIGQRRIDAPGIYVIDVAGHLLLKKALILPDGTLILRSDNQDDYPDDWRCDLARAADTVTVCGKVKAWWTLRKG